MKLSANEEYGIRCLIHTARAGMEGSMSIPEISRAEGLSQTYVAKLMRILRRAGFVDSARGKSGGYTLSRPASEIVLGEVLAALGGRLFEAGFCDRHSGEVSICTHSVACSVRSLWENVQQAVDKVLSNMSLSDLVSAESQPKAVPGELVTMSSGLIKPNPSFEAGTTYDV